MNESFNLKSDSSSDEDVGTTRRRKGHRTPESGATKKNDDEDVEELKKCFGEMTIGMKAMECRFNSTVATMQENFDSTVATMQENNDQLMAKNQKLRDQVLDLIRQLGEQEPNRRGDVTCLTGQCQEIEANNEAVIATYEINEKMGMMGKVWQYLCNLPLAAKVILCIGGIVVCAASVHFFIGTLTGAAIVALLSNA